MSGNIHILQYVRRLLLSWFTNVSKSEFEEGAVQAYKYLATEFTSETSKFSEVPEKSSHQSEVDAVITRDLWMFLHLHLQDYKTFGVKPILNIETVKAEVVSVIPRTLNPLGKVFGDEGYLCLFDLIRQQLVINQYILISLCV